MGKFARGVGRRLGLSIAIAFAIFAVAGQVQAEGSRERAAVFSPASGVDGSNGSLVASASAAGSTAEAAHPTAQHHDQGDQSWEAMIAVGTLLLVCVTAWLAFYTRKLWAATVELGAEAQRTSERRSGEINASLDNAVRSAEGIEALAEATRNNAVLMEGVMHTQLRAYVSVDLQNVIYQDERLRFEAGMRLTNHGFTPARNVAYELSADILPVGLPEGFMFPAVHGRSVNDAMLAPRESFVIKAPLPERIPDEEVDSVMQGKERRLYVWGTIFYDDIFGRPQRTDFCHSVTFVRWTDSDGSQKVRPEHHYHPTHNTAT
jgi:hypothetical protein